MKSFRAPEDEKLPLDVSEFLGAGGPTSSPASSGAVKERIKTAILIDCCMSLNLGLTGCKRKHYYPCMPGKKKNVHAVGLSGFRWKGKSKAQRSAHMKMMALKRWADYRRAEAALAKAEKVEETS